MVLIPGSLLAGSNAGSCCLMNAVNPLASSRKGTWEAAPLS